MIRRAAFVAVAGVLGVAVVLCAGCVKTTKVTGVMALQQGSQGDIQGCHIQLLDPLNPGGAPIWDIVPTGGSAQQVSFEFTEPSAGTYYLRAWKDVDNSTTINEGDIIGTYLGAYVPGAWGSQVTVEKGQTTDLGNLMAYVYQPSETQIVAAGWLTDSRTKTHLSYSFGCEAVLNSLTIHWPDGDVSQDEDAVGPVTAGEVNTGVWSASGSKMPTGLYRMEFVGVAGSDTFDITVQFTAD